VDIILPSNSVIDEQTYSEL